MDDLLLVKDRDEDKDDHPSYYWHEGQHRQELGALNSSAH